MERAETQAKISRILILVAAVGLLILLATSRSTLDETWQLLKSIKPQYLVLLPILKIFSYTFLANYYRALLGRLGHRLQQLHSVEVVMALDFVNQILPSGGVSGMSYLAYGLRNVSPIGTTTLVQLGRYILSASSYALILVVAALVLLLTHDINRAVGIVLVGLLVVSFLGLVALNAILLNRRRIDAFIQWLVRQLNRIASWLRRRPTTMLAAKAIQKVLDDFNDRIDMIRNHRGHLVVPFIFMLLSTLCEMAIVNVAFLAIGVTVHPAIIILAFASANVVGVISVVPGDVGVHELVMIFVLTAFGIDSAAAISATLLYRVFNKMLFLPIGFYFYSRVLKPAELKNG